MKLQFRQAAKALKAVFFLFYNHFEEKLKYPVIYKRVVYKNVNCFFVFFHIKSGGAWFAYEIPWNELEFIALILAREEKTFICLEPMT